MLETSKVLLKSATGESQGQVTLQMVSRQHAVRKGIRAWVICWIIGVVTLPIPLVHFVAPPLLLILGPAVGFVMFRIHNNAVDLVGGEAACPECQAPLVFETRSAQWPMDLACRQCNARLTMQVLGDF